MTEKLSIRLSLGGEGTPPPTEFRIFSYPKVKTTKGEFTFDETSATKVMASAADWGNEYSLDYDHDAVSPNPGARRVAAGWFKPEVRNGELWATDVNWTPSAAKHLADREYRYVSPAFQVDKDRRVVELTNVALTNIPATKGMQPIVANKLASDDAGSHTPTEASMSKLISLALLGKEDAEEKEVVKTATELSRNQTQLLSLTGKASADEAFAVVQAWKQAAAQNADLAMKLSTLEAEVSKREVSAMVDGAVRDGKLVPALREWALSQSPAAFKAYLDAAPVHATATPAPKEKAPADGGVVLSDADKLALKFSGLTEAQFLESKKELELRLVRSDV